jgi:hypothetical protein
VPRTLAVVVRRPLEFAVYRRPFPPRLMLVLLAFTRTRTPGATLKDLLKRTAIDTSRSRTTASCANKTRSTRQRVTQPELLADGHLAVKAYRLPDGGGRGGYVPFAVPDYPAMTTVFADIAALG